MRYAERYKVVSDFHPALIRQVIFCFATVLALTGCKPEQAQPSETASVTSAIVATETATPAQVPSKMALILAIDNIGRRVDIFERVAGAPKDASTDFASYEVEGCSFSVESQDNAVRMISLQLTDSCTADLGPLLGSSTPFPAGQSITFGNFEAAAGSAEYKAPCIASGCGNAFDPFVEAIVAGVHANGFNDVIATATLGGPTTDAWQEALTRATSEEYIQEAKFNCERTHDDLSRKMLADAVVERISFGQRDEQYPCT